MTTKLTPGDESDFGGNDWFECPGCEKNLKIYWFLGDDKTCKNCGTEIRIVAEVRTYPEAEDIGKFGLTESGSKVHVVRTGKDTTVCGRDDVTGPAEALPEFEDVCRSCIYITEMGEYGKGTKEERLQGARGSFMGKLRQAREAEVVS